MSGGDVVRLRGFLALLEAHGSGEICARDLAEAIAGDGGAARSALRAEGIVRDAERATTWACDGLGCAREVRELRPGAGAGARRFFAVCTRSPAECETIALSEPELAQERVSVEAFVAAVQRALRLTPTRESARTPTTAGEPWLLGEEIVGVGGKSRRDVFLVRHAGPELRALLAERANGERGTRVIVLTERALEGALVERYGERTEAARVTFDVLADLLAVEDGRIAVASRRLRALPAWGAESPSPANAARDSSAPPPAPPRPRSPGLDGLPHVTRWREVTLFDVDDETLLGVALGGRSRRLSCVDFGLAESDGRQPLQHFKLLRTICLGNGDFQTRRFGTASNGKRILSELRTAMKGTFGVDDDPFERYSRRDKCWRTKFRALSAAPREARELLRELAERGALAPRG